MLVTGDAAQHLMWRLRKGEVVPSQGPHLSVIIIGSSDLTYASFQVHHSQALLCILSWTICAVYLVMPGGRSLPRGSETAVLLDDLNLL